jgi:hypothetical protein
MFLPDHSHDLSTLSNLHPRAANSDGTINSNLSDGAIIIIVLVAAGFSVLLGYSMTRFFQAKTTATASWRTTSKCATCAKSANAVLGVWALIGTRREEGIYLRGIVGVIRGLRGMEMAGTRGGRRRRFIRLRGFGW